MSISIKLLALIMARCAAFGMLLLILVASFYGRALEQLFPAYLAFIPHSGVFMLGMMFVLFFLILTLQIFVLITTDNFHMYLR